MTIQNCCLFPFLSHHVFWNHKANFQLSVDIYDHWVLFAVEGGSFSYQIDDVEGIAQMGDVVVCPPGVSFHRSVINTLSFHFIGFSFGSIQEELTKRNEDEHVVRLQLNSSAYKLIIGQMERLADNLKFLKQHFDVGLEQQLYWQNHALNDIWRFCQQSEVPSGDQENEPIDPLIEQAKLYIQQHGFGEMSLLNLAAELGISPVQLSRRFSKSAGMTPSRYLSHIRLEKVKALLIDTQLPIEKIAQACGFNNGFYLSRVFTKILKTSPSAYRKMNRV